MRVREHSIATGGARTQVAGARHSEAVAAEQADSTATARKVVSGTIG